MQNIKNNNMIYHFIVYLLLTWSEFYININIVVAISYKYKIINLKKYFIIIS